ncbi:hypothetical protein P8452_66547 [Trifolium repens]|nr:hypothetical protein P8452_66547 [Trifolium repens]
MKQRLGRTKPMHQVLHLLCRMVNHIPLKGFVYFPYHSHEDHSPVSASTICRLVYHCFASSHILLSSSRLSSPSLLLVEVKSCIVARTYTPWTFSSVCSFIPKVVHTALLPSPVSSTRDTLPPLKVILTSPDMQETANTLLERLGDKDIWIREQASKLLPRIVVEMSIVDHDSSVHQSMLSGIRERYSDFLKILSTCLHDLAGIVSSERNILSGNDLICLAQRRLSWSKKSRFLHAKGLEQVLKWLEDIKDHYGSEIFSALQGTVGPIIVWNPDPSLYLPDLVRNVYSPDENQSSASDAIIGVLKRHNQNIDIIFLLVDCLNNISQSLDFP